MINYTWNNFVVDNINEDSVETLKISYTGSNGDYTHTLEQVISMSAEGIQDKSIGSFNREKCILIAESYAEREGWRKIINDSISGQIAEASKIIF